MKKIYLLMLSLAMVLSAPGWAALNDPVLVNPSFENPDLSGDDGGILKHDVPDWWDADRYVFVTRDDTSDYPETPYGNNWGELGNGRWIYQQIGTYEEDMVLDVSFLAGQAAAGKNFEGIYVSLLVGGDPALAADYNSKYLDDNPLVNTVGATEIANTDLIDPFADTPGVAATSEQVFTFNTGTGYTVGDPLWVMIARPSSSGRSLIDNVNVELAKTAILPVPENGEARAAIDADLEWSAPPVGTVQKYVLTYRNDPNFDEPGNTIVDPVTSPYDMGTMPYKATYFWKVDVVDALGETIEGKVWSFTTVPEVPVIEQQPQGVLVADDGTEDVMLTISGLNIENFQWLKDGGPIAETNVSGIYSDTLIITSANANNEGVYTCVVDNGGTAPEDTVTSEAALVMTKRLVAQYEFENNLADSQGYLGDGVIIDPNTADPNVPDISYTTGLNGGSAILFNSHEGEAGYQAGLVEMPTSAGLLNFYDLGMTVSAWVKFNTPDSSYMSAIAAAYDDELGEYDWFLNRYYGDARWRTSGLTVSDSNLENDLRDGGWHLFTGVYDPVAEQTAVYVDGVLAGTTAGTAVPGVNSLATLRVGAYYATESGLADRAMENAAVDDLRIYSYPLDNVAVAKMYTEVMGGSICVDDEGLEYDFNDDCKVDIADFAEIAATWLNCRIVPDCID